MTGLVVVVAVAVMVTVAYGLVAVVVLRSRRVAEHYPRWRYRQGARALARVTCLVRAQARSQ